MREVTTSEVRCEFAEDLKITDVHELTIPNLLPDGNYDVTVAPMFVEFLQYKEPNYIVGPESQVFQLLTGQDAPESAPLNFDTSSRDSVRVDLVWDEPLLANGQVSYSIDCSCSQNEVSERTSWLLPSTEYTFTVTPFTTADAGPNATVTVKTCQEDTRATAKTRDACFALPGFILAEDGVTARPCADFAQEIVVNVCFYPTSDLGVNASSLVMREGFWRTSSDSSDFRACPLAGACVGGLTDDLCQANYTGSLCAVCEEDFFLNGQVCVSCLEEGVLHYLPLIIFLVLLISAAVATRRIARQRETTSLKVLESTGTISKVLLTTFQILSAFTWSLGVAFPELEPRNSHHHSDFTENNLPLGCASSYLTLENLRLCYVRRCLSLFQDLCGLYRVG